MAKDAKHTLERLEQVARQHDDLSEAVRALRVRRDFLMVAAYRHGASLRTIAKVAGLHWTTVQSVVADASEVIDTAGLPTVWPKTSKKLPPARRPKKT